MGNAFDNWAAGNAYEAFMGRWSSQVADLFLDWLAPTPRANWLEVGCGTGALTRAICRRSQPASLVACDPSPEFLAFARKAIAGCPSTFVLADSDHLPRREDGYDLVVSGLVLNFMPQPARALNFMRDRIRPGGVLAAYVWDYAEGMQFLRFFWDEAEALEASAARLHEGRRFPLSRPDQLAQLFSQAGLITVEFASLEIDTIFPDFDAYWSPFLGGTGPAPAYVASLTLGARTQLAERLRERLPRSPDGAIRLKARAFSLRGIVAN